VKAVENPRDNLRVITRLVDEVLAAPDAPDDFSSLKEDVKQLCADHNIAYDSDVTATAIESALARRRKTRAS
jgi:hypothetical protein